MSTKIPWDLIVGKLRNELSSIEEDQFQAWLTEDNNEHLFAQLMMVWDKIQNKVAVYEPDIEYYWNELSSRMDNLARDNTKKVKSVKKTYSLVSLYRKIAVAAMLLIATGAGLYYYIMQNNANAVQTYMTGAEKMKIQLPDGTEVWLNSNTVLTYRDVSKPDLREVNLEGEAYFDVIHNQQKPFIVKSEEIAVIVHGTQFNVNTSKQMENTIITLYEGAISLKIADIDFFLKPGEEATYNKGSKTVHVEKGDVGYAKTWMQDRVRLENKNLHDVCRYLSKWYNVEIEIDPDIPNDQSYAFTLKDQSLDEVLQTMLIITPSLEFKNMDNKIIITQK